MKQENPENPLPVRNFRGLKDALKRLKKSALAEEGEIRIWRYFK